MRLSLARVVGAGLVATFVLAGAAALSDWLPARFGWDEAHRAFALAGVVLPGLYLLTQLILSPLLPAPVGRGGDKAILSLVGAVLLTLNVWEPATFFPWAHVVGTLLLAFGAFVHLLSLRDAVPKSSLVDVARDPLTKGDDACVKQLRLGAMMLVAGLAASALLALATALAPLGVALDAGLLARFQLAADHLLLVGFGLPTLFGVSHLLVPRLSGVPAIAAGAIKGELHSTLLGVVLLTAGFASGIKGLTITGGLVAFFAAFVWMGVLGANIMKNKSRTQRVTPGFAYIPWVFAGVLWVVVGVLLGLFLNIVPQVFADRLPALRSIHVHLLLFGGALQLGLGLATRAVAAEPVPFSEHRWAFWLLNVALGVLAWGTLTGSAVQLAVSAGLALLGLAAWFFPLRRRAAQVKA